MINNYKKEFQLFFEDSQILDNILTSVDLIKYKTNKRIFFIGNGGSNSICSHMMEDFAKILRIPTFTFSDPALITCFSNDYGYENAIKEWLSIHLNYDDILIAISSSGESKNIINATLYAKDKNIKIITLTGFEKNNTLSKLGDINFYLNSSSYGIVECFHQTILHIILDTLIDK
jgi:D-sedoheptulose 7-phosphate isomerase